MKSALAFVLLMTFIFGPPSDTRQGNENLANGQTKEALQHYKAALEARHAQSPAVHYNMGLAYLKSDSVGQALNHFQMAVRKNNDSPSTWAWNNSAVIQADSSKLDKALESLKNALRADPSNETARYNYEVLKRRIQNQQNNNEPPPPQDSNEPPPPQDNPNNPPPPKQNQPPPQENSGEHAEGQISMEKARQLLDAMNQNEKQFIQELRKSKKVKSHSANGPDW